MGWTEAMPTLNAAVMMDNVGAYVVIGLLYLIIGFSIVNTVLMSVMNRSREFGVLHALGMTPRQTALVVLIEGLAMTVVSGVVGVALGILLSSVVFSGGIDMTGLIQEDMVFGGVLIDPVIYPLFSTTRIVQAVSFITLIGFVSSVYPAYRAATINVIESMKFDR